MNFKMLKTLRTMTGNALPAVHIIGIGYEDDNRFRVMEATADALSRDYRDFLKIYNMQVNPRCFKLEEIFGRCIVNRFSAVADLRGVDIIYSDMTVKMRIVIDGIDTPTPHSNYLTRSNSIINYNGSTAVVKFERFKTSDAEEYWEYYITP